MDESDDTAIIEEVQNGIVLYHRAKEHETVDDTATAIWEMLRSVYENDPYAKITLELEFDSLY
jgi:hypothetical protein